MTGRLDRLHQIATLKRDHDLARLREVAQAQVRAEAKAQDLASSLAEQARIASETGDLAADQAFDLHARYCDRARADLDQHIESLKSQREQLRANAALSFGRTIALERLAARVRDDLRRAANARAGN